MDCAYHPGKEAAAACVNCGKLICIECKTELAGKNYCPPCANEIFVARKPVEAVETPAVAATKPAEAVETPAVAAMKPAEAVETPARAVKATPGVRKMPTGATKGVTEAVAVPARVTKGATTADERISGAWWLMPVFLVWIGGLVAWLVNKDKAPKRSRSMLIWGIVLTFVYPIIGTVALWVVALAIGGTLQVTGPQMPTLGQVAVIAVVAIVIVVAIALSFRKKGTKRKDGYDDWDDDGGDDGDD